MQLYKYFQDTSSARSALDVAFVTTNPGAGKVNFTLDESTARIVLANSFVPSGGLLALPKQIVKGRAELSFSDAGRRVVGSLSFDAVNNFGVGLGRITASFSGQTNSFIPTITLTLSPASVNEDGTSNLVYALTRNGSIEKALKANFTVGGSATPGIDYSSSIVNSAGIKSITFLAGSSTARIVINPNADRNQEVSETVILRLAGGAGYTIGTTTAVIGTIVNDDLIGTASNNTLLGTATLEYIDGLQGRDTLTGGTGPDVFGFRYGHSTFTAPDRITDFQFGSDQIDLLTATGAARPAPTAFSRASDNTTAATLSELAAVVFSDANGAADGTQPFAANAAVLVVATRAPIAGTYLLINDGIASRSNSNDLLINISGFSGVLPALGGISVGSVFA
ncbi:MAG: bluetail domain-containing putative surface protein [Cyanobium sp.]